MPGAGSRAPCGDEGAGGALALMIVLVAVSLCAAVLAGGTAVIAHARAAATADSAALAAASALAGFAVVEPCEAAAEVAAANGATLATCEIDGTAVTVGCQVQATGLRITAVSRAGQPDGG